jgi:hypothetical protein
MSNYPKQISKSVLLLDGQIINWKIGTTIWRTVDDAFRSRQLVWLFFDIFTNSPERLTVDSISKLVKDVEENNEFFECRKWFTRYKIHEKYNKHMLRPY